MSFEIHESGTAVSNRNPTTPTHTLDYHCYDRRLCIFIYIYICSIIRYTYIYNNIIITFALPLAHLLGTPPAAQHLSTYLYIYISHRIYKYAHVFYILLSHRRYTSYIYRCELSMWYRRYYRDVYIFIYYVQLVNTYVYTQQKRYIAVENPQISSYKLIAGRQQRNNSAGSNYNIYMSHDYIYIYHRRYVL